MKYDPKEMVYQAAEQMTLPSEVLGASQIEITGCRQVSLCGHKGIRAYGECEMIVDMRDHAVIIQGTGLRIVSMTKTELLIHGTISGVSMIR